MRWFQDKSEFGSGPSVRQPALGPVPAWRQPDLLFEDSRQVRLIRDSCVLSNVRQGRVGAFQFARRALDA
ncbi:MAG TPA: hypothetical protein VN428_17735 [Bryobacteraceae bacterium]|nr:hypothetical protein [Bryobacteraceae bacterium]